MFPEISTLRVVSVFAANVPSALHTNPSTVTDAAVSVVSPPGFDTSTVTFFTRRPPESVSSMLLTTVTVPEICSPVSSKVTAASSPTLISAASPERNGTVIFITESS